MCRLNSELPEAPHGVVMHATEHEPTLKGEQTGRWSSVQPASDGLSHRVALTVPGVPDQQIVRLTVPTLDDAKARPLEYELTFNALGWQLGQIGGNTSLVITKQQAYHFVSYLETWHEDQQREPSPDDLRWPRAAAELLDEHISLGNDRPTLSCQLVEGRAYSLTPGQRDVVREWFNMTPAPLVEVIECTMYKDSKHIRRVTLRSCEHVDPRRRRVMNKFSIDQWGRFMSEAKAHDEAREEAKRGTDVVDDDAEAPRSKSGKKANKQQVNLDELMNEYGV